MIVFENLIVRSDDFTLSADFAIEPRGKIALLGASGAGKSTLLIALAGLMDIDAGRIIYDGQGYYRFTARATPCGRCYFRIIIWFAHLTVRQNIALGLRPRFAAGGGGVGRRWRVLWHGLGLADYGTRLPAQLSGGQAGRAGLGTDVITAQTRVMFGRAVCRTWTSLAL